MTIKTVRNIVHIDEEKCDGCGACAIKCAEGALKIIDGKARLVSENYCDGLGACLGECPQGAITIEERAADEFDEEAVAEYLKTGAKEMPCGYSSTSIQEFERKEPADEISRVEVKSSLGHWPVQLMLVPPHAPFLRGANLLICADCVPFAVPDFHERYLNGKAVVVGCPKLDDLQHYFEKLQAIFQTARPERVTVLRMEVPCCGGIAQAAIKAAEMTCCQRTEFSTRLMRVKIACINIL